MMTDSDNKPEEQSRDEEENTHCTLSDDELDDRLERFIKNGGDDDTLPMTYRQLEILHRRTRR